MIEVEKIEVMGFQGAIRGMRNPLNSWARSDSTGYPHFCGIGPADLDLMKRLAAAGPEHRKFMRQIFVSMDITAPLYWWKEFDTYKVGTTANSCSTMHKLTAKRFTLDDFSTDHIEPEWVPVMTSMIANLNDLRDLYLQTKDKGVWYTIIQLLPSSYNQKRTVTMTYENAFNIIQQRTGHKMDEWNTFVSKLLQLPYMQQLVSSNGASDKLE